jgi:hypothetical protein
MNEEHLLGFNQGVFRFDNFKQVNFSLNLFHIE